MDTDFRPITKAGPDAWKKKVSGGCLCLMLGLAPLPAVNIYYDTRNLRPVNLAVPPHPVTLHTGPFTINYPGGYEINYRAQRTFSYDKLSCLLGVKDFEQEKCGQPLPKFATSWVLRSNTGDVITGQSEHWSWQGASADWVDAGIGSFHGKAGAEYTLDVTIKNDTSALAATHPRLVVEIHPMYTEGWIVPELLTLLIVIILVPVGLWQIISGLVARNWRPE